MKRLLVLALCVLALSGCAQDVTAPRLERSLGPTFARLYAQRSELLGTTTVTPATVRPVTTCDRGGPTVEDVGPGADWICTVAFTDDAGKRQDGTFELQVRAGSTWTASGPSRLVGLATITDATTGQQVPNPAFEFDGAFDPRG